MSNPMPGCPFSIGDNGNLASQKHSDPSSKFGLNLSTPFSIPEHGNIKCTKSAVNKTVNNYTVKPTIINSNNISKTIETAQCNCAKTKTTIRRSRCGTESCPVSNQGSPIRKTSVISCVSSFGGSDEKEGKKKLDLSGVIESIGTLLIPEERIVVAMLLTLIALNLIGLQFLTLVVPPGDTQTTCLLHYKDGLRRRMEDLKKNIIKVSATVEEEKRKNVELLSIVFPSIIAQQLWRRTYPVRENL